MADVPAKTGLGSDSPDTQPEANQSFCIDADRVYDSCGDKDCLSEMRVFFTEVDQSVINSAVSVRIREANIINTVVNVEPVTYHCGFYSVDMTFYFEIVLDVFTGGGAVPASVSGLSVFAKRVILYGGNGNVAVFTSEPESSCVDPEAVSLPTAKVQVAQPMALTACLTECCSPCMPSAAIPPCVVEYFGGQIVPSQSRSVLATIGVFTIVQLKRTVQMLIPAFDYCVPDKECVTSTDNPCDMFSRVDFPVEQFFPPNLADIDPDNLETGCGCG